MELVVIMAEGLHVEDFLPHSATISAAILRHFLLAAIPAFPSSSHASQYARASSTPENLKIGR